MKTTFTLFPSSLLRAGLFAALLLLAGGQAFATTYTFTGAGGTDNWNDEDNWSPNYPGTIIYSGDEIIIDGSCTVNEFVESYSPITINSLRTLTIASTLSMYDDLTNNGTIQVNGQLQIYGTFTHNGTSTTISGSLYNTGTVTINAGKTLTINQWAYYYHEDGTITCDGSFVNNGNIVFYAGSLTVSDTWFTYTGSIDLGFGYTSNFIVDGDITIPSSGGIYGGATVTVNAGKTLTMEGALDLYGGNSTIWGTLLIENYFGLDSYTELTIENGGKFTHNGGTASVSGTLTNNGTVTVNAGKTLTVNETGTFTNNNIFNHNGVLNGEGTFGGTVGFTNPSGGNISPGASPGCMTFPDGFTNDGTITLEVNGTTACSQFDRLNVTGTATLGGTLNVSIGYTPTNGDVITFLNATSISGTFASINPPLPTGWSLAYDIPNAGEVSLQYALLPVELVSFQTEKQNDHTVLLNWRTASEHNNQGFHIQRSSDGRSWQTLGFMPGHGTTLEAQSYTYTDEHPRSGINYYRLKQLDFDGQFEYSNTQSVMLEGSISGVQVYPNPTKSDGQLNVNLPTEPEGYAVLRIFDANGQLLHREVLANQFNQTGYGHLPAGVCFIEVISGQVVWRERLIVQ